MRDVRDIYNKYREIKFIYLTKLYKKYFKKISQNCRYNYPYKFISDNNEYEIRLCLLHQPNLDMGSGVFPQLIDVCQELHHCSKCNAFVFKYTKEDIKNLFEEELKNRVIKEKRYPEICALEWVLERNDEQSPPLSGIKVIFYTIKNLIKDVFYERKKKSN